MKRTWILIAGGSGARILETKGKGRELSEHTVSGGYRHPAGADTAPPQHGLEERPNVTNMLDALFASQLSAMLADRLKQGCFDTLILVAPEAMLNKLRKMISPAVRETITAEIERDLTNIPTTEIAHHLDDVMPR
ncbi:MAG TPA: host attachment protein [Hyphomicrobium sp.]|nr:host attachment protein [Hyphomicrobium sp.]